MWLMTQLDNEVYQLLNQRGLQISGDVIYSSESASIHNAIVRINIGDAAYIRSIHKNLLCYR